MIVRYLGTVVTKNHPSPFQSIQRRFSLLPSRHVYAKWNTMPRCGINVDRPGQYACLL